MADKFVLAQGVVEVAFADKGLSQGLYSADSAMQKIMDRTDGMTRGLSAAAIASEKLTRSLGGAASLAGGALADILGGFAMGGGAGAGLAAAGAAIPLIVEGVHEIKDWWQKANESVKTHIDYTHGMTEAYRKMMAAAKDATKESKDGLDLLREAMRPNAAERNLQGAGRNQGRGKGGLEDDEIARLDAADAALAEAENKQRDAIKRMKQQAEPADDIFNAERKLEALGQGRARIEERRAKGEAIQQRGVLDDIMQDRMAAEGKKMADADAKDRMQRERAAESQERADFRRRDAESGEDAIAGKWLQRQHDETVKAMQADKAAAAFRPWRGGIEQMSGAIQDSIGRGAADVAAKRIEEGNKILQQIEEQAKKLNIAIDRQDQRARAG